MSLTITDLNKTYPNGVKALHGVSLVLQNGMFGLLGPNGAGKSTLMRTLATLQQPNSDLINLNGIDVLAQPHEVRCRLGYLPQDFGVPQGISASQLLDYIAVVKGVRSRLERDRLVTTLLHQTNLYEVRNRAVSRYSGGMRQRFGIAQALIGQPDLIIADEPTAGLDPEERHRFHNLLCELGEDRIVILSTHIVEDIENLCPHMAVLHEGRLKFTGTPESCREMVAGKIWKRQAGKKEIASIGNAHKLISTLARAGKFEVRVFSDSDLNAGAASAGSTSFGYEPVRASLEDAYFNIIRHTA